MSHSRALLLLLALAPALHAQQTIIDRAGQGTPTPPAPVAADDLERLPPGAETDAGTQRVAEPRKLPFRLSATFDEQLYAASNIFLAPDSSPVADEGALVSATTLALRLDSLPRVVREGQVVLSAGLVWQRYLHGLASSDPAIEELDFDSYALPLSATCRWGRGWEAAAAFTAGSLYSIRGEPSYELLYRNYTPSLSLRKLTGLGRRSILSAGVSISYSDTWTSLRDVPAIAAYRDDRNDKTDAALDVACYRFAGRWTFNGSARLGHAHYFHWEEGDGRSYDRNDITLGAGLGVTYAFETWGSVRLFGTYDIRSSDSDSFVDYDHDGGTAGLGLTLSVRY